MTEHSGFEIFSSKEHLSDPNFRQEWERLVDESGTPYGMYGSPDWILHVLETSGKPVRVWSLRDAVGGLQGLVPVGVSPYHLSFEAANRKILNVPLQAAHIPGGVPPLPKDSSAHFRFFDAVFSELPECDGLFFDMVPWDHWFSEFLREDQRVNKRYTVHSPFGARKWRMLRVAGSFEDYLGRLGSKSRYTLRKNVRKLEDGTGPLELRRVDRPDQVPEFLRIAVEVSRNSWQHRALGTRISDSEKARRSAIDLAARGLLRAYLLFSGGDPCAFSISYQHRGIVNSHELGFHRGFAPHSPGTVLLYLMIEDLHLDGGVRLLNFGMGDADYKRRFADIESAESSWLVMRRSIRNRFLARSHGAFDATVVLAKKMARRWGRRA